MSDERSWPELGEELARKSLEHVESRFKAFQAGRLSRREMFLIADALHDAMHGLAPADATDAVYAVRQSIKNKEI